MTFRNTSRVLIVLSALVALPLTLSGCAAVDDEDQEAAEDVSSPSPPDQFEVVPVLESPTTQIWRPGYWAPGSGLEAFVWVPGAIIPKPSPTAVWARARWVHHEYGWSFQEGHWQ
jgi:hypothetical protein